MPFPFSELSYDMQCLVAHAVLDPRDRASLCLAQPRLGLKLTDKPTGLAPYTDFLFRVGMELLLTGVPVDEISRRYARDDRATYDGAKWLNGLAKKGMGKILGTPTETTYCLEVVRFISGAERILKGHPRRRVKAHEHVGYMSADFQTKTDAASYYNRNNKHMRQLNAHGSWQSDWDPDTYLLYFVHEHHLLYASVAPFDLNDEPSVSETNPIS